MVYTYKGPDAIAPDLDVTITSVEQMRKDLRLARIQEKVLASKIATATRKNDALTATLATENDALNATRKAIERAQANEARTIAAARDEAASITAKAAADAHAIIADAERNAALVREKARQQARALLDGEYTSAYQKSRDEAMARKSVIRHLRIA